MGNHGRNWWGQARENKKPETRVAYEKRGKTRVTYKKREKTRMTDASAEDVLIREKGWVAEVKRFWALKISGT